MKPKTAFFSFLFFLFLFLLIGSWLLVKNFSSPLMLYSVILLSFFAPCTLILHVVVDCFGGDTFCVMTVWFYMWLLTISGVTHSAYQFDFTWGCWLFQGLHILHDISLILHVVVDYFRGHTFCMISVWFYMWLLTLSRATYSAWRQFDFTCGCWLFQGRHILREDSLILQVVVDCFRGDIFCVMTLLHAQAVTFQPFSPSLSGLFLCLVHPLAVT